MEVSREDLETIAAFWNRQKVFIYKEDRHHFIPMAIAPSEKLIFTEHRVDLESDNYRLPGASGASSGASSNEYFPFDGKYFYLTFPAFEAGNYDWNALQSIAIAEIAIAILSWDMDLKPQDVRTARQGYLQIPSGFAGALARYVQNYQNYSGEIPKELIEFFIQDLVWQKSQTIISWIENSLVWQEGSHRGEQTEALFESLWWLEERNHVTTDADAIRMASVIMKEYEGH